MADDKSRGLTVISQHLFSTLKSKIETSTVGRFGVQNWFAFVTWKDKILHYFHKVLYYIACDGMVERFYNI